MCDDLFHYGYLYIINVSNDYCVLNHISKETLLHFASQKLYLAALRVTWWHNRSSNDSRIICISSYSLTFPNLKPNNNACKDPHKASIDHKNNVLQLLERILYNSGSNWNVLFTFILITVRISFNYIKHTTIPDFDNVI